MNEDPIKLREALFAAEPYLHFLLTERTVTRNNKPLEDALNKVRGALGMDPINPPSSKVDISKLENDKIELVAYKEHDDGSATCTFDLHGDTPKLLMRIGLSRILHEAAEMYKDVLDAPSE